MGFGLALKSLYNISPIFLARPSTRKDPTHIDADEKLIRALFVLRGRVIKDTG